MCGRLSTMRHNVLQIQLVAFSYSKSKQKSIEHRKIFDFSDTKRPSHYLYLLLCLRFFIYNFRFSFRAAFKSETQLKINIMSKIKSFFSSDTFYLIEYILSKVTQFLFYGCLIVGILSLIKYLVTCP